MDAFPDDSSTVSNSCNAFIDIGGHLESHFFCDAIKCFSSQLVVFYEEMNIFTGSKIQKSLASKETDAMLVSHVIALHQAFLSAFFFIRK